MIHRPVAGRIEQPAPQPPVEIGGPAEKVAAHQPAPPDKAEHQRNEERTVGPSRRDAEAEWLRIEPARQFDEECAGQQCQNDRVEVIQGAL